MYAASSKCYNLGHSLVNSPEIGSYPLRVKINALGNAIFGKHRIRNNNATKYNFVVEPVMFHRCSNQINISKVTYAFYSITL